MRKKEFIKRYGKAAYEDLERRIEKWRRENPTKLKEHGWAQNRKGGARYEKKKVYNRTGIPGARQKIRLRHGGKFHKFKKIIAPDSQIHHQWRQGSAKYDGVALVERDQHMRGFVNVIQILEGEITLFTEKEIRERQ